MRAAAHTPREPGGEWHDLATHLRVTAELARERAAKYDTGDLAYTAGLIHDVGKYNPAFQQYLQDAAAGRPATSAPHAVYGALLAVEHGLAELAWPIFGHHGGLPSRDDLQRKAFDNPDVLASYQAIKAALGELSLPEVTGSRPGVDLVGEMLLRMVFSALVDADYLDTEAHFDPSRAAQRTPPARPDDLLPVLLAAQGRIMTGATGGAVNEVRREVYECCLTAATGPRGVYRLAVPTGGGKTRSGLAFALQHAVHHDFDRVIVAVPYLSITDQTAATYREIFGVDAVLEHHSGVISREPTGRNRLAVQNWDAPLIVTTTVQLLESLLSNRPSRCRKLHNVARSVLVLDEVQTLPARLLAPILDALRALTERYGCTVVLSTATQPALEASPQLSGFEGVRDIVPSEKAAEHFRRLRRVRYEVRSDAWGWDRAGAELRGEQQAMAIVNTRSDAADLLDAVGGDALHLSASMCAAHRREVLREVYRRLDGGEPCVLVSTQVVEAGVDIDFPVVMRAFGPLDRIVQAAGRCNREGRLEEGRVLVFEPAEGTMPPGEYRTGSNLAANILRRGADLHDPSIFRSYFSRLYRSVDTDAENIQRLRAQFDYPAVAERFRIVDDGQIDVIVEYDDQARGLVERITGERELRPGDLRRLQAYTVGLYPNDFDVAADDRTEIAEGVWLWTGEYDAVGGLQVAKQRRSRG